MKLENRFLVLKWADVHEALTQNELNRLEYLANIVHAWRASLDKPDNQYVVINLDEPYAPEVLKLMKHEGQEGE